MARSTYRVINRRELWYMRLPDHMEYGYETGRDFRDAVGQLVDRWHDRVGEAVGDRHGCLLLRFHDTPGGAPDEAWLPACMLVPSEGPGPQAPDAQPAGGLSDEIDSAFGFD